MLRCVTGSCTLKWKGANDHIYHISEAVCVGEEICWDFVDMVSSMKCNFSASCFLMHSSYNRHNSARKFMSVKTFIRVFFFLGLKPVHRIQGSLQLVRVFAKNSGLWCDWNWHQCKQCKYKSYWNSKKWNSVENQAQ